MGYEVLDTGGTRPATPAPPGAPVDVIAFGDEREGVPPAAPSGRPPGRSWTHLPRPTTPGGRALVVLVAVALVLGVLAGSWWGSHHADDVQRTRDLATVHAYALATSVDTHASDEGQVADFAFTVFNVGSTPLHLVTSPGTARPSLTDPLMSVLTGDGTVAPGHSAAVSARVPLDCASEARVQFTLPVRSADGGAHRLTPQATDQGGFGQPARNLCSSNVVDPLMLSFAGSLSRPVLVLQNTTADRLTVSIDSSTAMGQTGATALRLSTTPAMPLVVPPNATVRVLLRLDVTRCPRNLNDSIDPGGTFLQLRVEGAATGPAQSGIDTGPLTGAALQRTCSR